jgi:hypothetical protein
MALLERKERTDLLDQSPNLYVKVNNTDSENIHAKNTVCDFCNQELTKSGYCQTESGIVLCQPCLSYLVSLKPIAKQAFERILLGNVV